MEAPSSKEFFERAFNQLLDIYDSCESNKRQCNLICQDYKRLTKPWPQRKSIEKLNKAKTVMQHKGADTTNDLSKSSSSEEIPEHEKAELMLVNKLLKKAEVTRQKLPSISQEIETKEDLTDCKNVNKKIVPHVKKNEAKDKQGGIKIKKALPEASYSTIGVIKSSVLENVLKPSTAVRSKPPVSARSKVVPAHAKAPFKTDVRVRKTDSAARKSGNINQRSQSYERASSQHERKLMSAPTPSLESKKTSLAANVNRDRRIVKNQTQDFLKKTYSEPELAKVSNVLTEQSQVINDMVYDESLKTSKEFNCTPEEHKELKQCNNDSGSGDTPEEPKNVEEHGSQPFLFLRDGNKLNIPPKLKRLYMNNVRLRSRVRLINLTRKVNSKTAAQRFLERMETMLEQDRTISPELSSFQQIIHLTKEYRTLHVMWKHLQINATADLKNTTDILLLKRTAEYIILTCKELDKQFHKLGYDTKDYVSLSAVITEPHHKNNAVWLPQSFYPDIQVMPEKKMKYSCCQELLEFMTTLHNIQVSRLQLHLLDCVGSEVLTLLESCDVDRSYISFYRCAYGLLCSGGLQFPAMVTDQLDDARYL